MPDADRERAFKQADDIVKIAADIVKLFTGEEAD
jgi:hypothetical protein